jgi:hypothetical protein
VAKRTPRLASRCSSMNGVIASVAGRAPLG